MLARATGSCRYSVYFVYRRKVQILTPLQLGVHFRGTDVLVDKDRECCAQTVPAKVYVCVYVCMYVYACMYIHVYIHICTYVCMYVCMYSCMHMSTYIYIYRDVLTRGVCLLSLSLSLSLSLARSHVLPRIYIYIGLSSGRAHARREPARIPAAKRRAGTQFTCFTSTKVQILTRRCLAGVGRGRCCGVDAGAHDKTSIRY